jgi:uncharacterized protein (TIGR02271 family)
MIDSKDLQSIAGNTMTGQDGQKIGKIVDVYESTQDADGTFVTVHTGMFGGNASFVPLAKASLQGKDVVVPYDKALVKDAPRVEADQELSAAEEERLYQHYSLQRAASPAPAPAPGRHAEETAVPRGTKRQDNDGDGVFDDVKDTAVGRDTSGLTTGDAMTRSEERLQVGTQQVETGRARLRKRIVTEQVSTTVPVTRDEVVVEREPITEANMPKATDGPALSEEEHEVVLKAEQPVVTKETVPVERVKLGTQTVTEQQQVNETIRKEQIETADPTGKAGKPGR